MSVPPPPGPEPDEELSEERRERIWARVVSELEARGIPLDEPLVDPRRAGSAPDAGGRRPVPLLAAAAAVVVAVAVGAALWASAPRDDGHAVAAGGSSTTASPPLDGAEVEAVARAAEAADPVPFGTPGARYAHRVVVARQGLVSDGHLVVREETWVDPLGTGRRSTTVLEGAEAAPADERPTAPGSLLLGIVPAADVAGLPTEPDALAATLLAEGGGRSSERESLLPSLVADLLAVSVLPPAVRAAGVRILADIGLAVLDRDATTLTLGATTDGLEQVVTLTRDGVAVEVVLTQPDGTSTTRTFSEVDVRATVGSG